MTKPLFSNPLRRLPSWLAVSLLATGLIGVVVTSVALETPVGSLEGKLALEQPGHGLSSQDIRGKKVYAIAIGPRNGAMQEHGVWVEPDGHFRFGRLPVGEYTLKVRAPGYATHYESSVFISEGATASLKKTVVMNLLAPSITIASNTRVFTPAEKPTFWVNATGGDKATITIARFDALKALQSPETQKFLEFTEDLSVYKPAPKVLKVEFLPWLAKQPTIQTFERVLNRQNDPYQEDWSRTTVQLNKPLPPGEYLAVATVKNPKGEADTNLQWFSVSSLGLIMKQAPEKTVVRAIDLVSLKPVANVRVDLLNRENSNKAEATIQTGSDGFAQWNLPSAWRQRSQLRLIAVGTDGTQKAYGGIPFWMYGNDRYQTYFYTERPVYRLGQTVYFKSIIRQQEQGSLSTPKPGLPVDVRVQDPDSQVIWKGKLLTSRFGTLHGLFDVPKEAKTGAYSAIFTYPDGHEDYGYFEVAQYRKPEFQVEVTPLTPRVVSGQSLKARIRATYYFGSPVANARIRYTIYRATDWDLQHRLIPRPANEAYFDDWDEYGNTYNPYAGDYMTEGYAQTDANGEAVVTYTTPASRTDLTQGPGAGNEQNLRYSVEAEVTDLSRMVVMGKSAVNASAGQFALFIEPGRYVVKAGEPIPAKVTAMGFDGKPIANQNVTVQLQRWIWDQDGNYRMAESIDPVGAKTDSSGVATVTLPGKTSLPNDSYTLIARSSDNQGHTIVQDTSVWVASALYAGGDSTSSQPAMAMTLDRKVYEPGETARVMVTAPLDNETSRKNGKTLRNNDVEAIVAIEGARLYDVKTVALKDSAQLVEIPIKPEYTPNVYVSVTLVNKKRQFYHQTRMIKVSPDSHFLNITVQTDKPRYHPGETAKYTITASQADGKPASGVELSLGVVDESLYAVRPESAPNIRKFFYRPRENTVLTLSSFPETYSGGPDKLEPRIRKDFRDMAVWIPDLVTDAHGKASATVTLPDNLTQWRATVRGVSQATDVGETTQKITVYQDLMVRLALPRFFTVGDETRLTSLIHNETDQSQQILAKLAVSPQFKTSQALDARITVPPHGVQRLEWPVRLAETGKGTLLLKAYGNHLSDAVELERPIQPRGIEVTRLQQGLLSEKQPAIVLKPDIPQGSSRANWQVRLSGSPVSTLNGHLSSLIDYPYGCTEQTTSRLVPAITAMRLHKELGLALPEASTQQYASVVAKSLQRLSQLQTDSGGWGWWEHDEPNTYLTAYVLEGLHELTKSGYPVSSSLQQNGLAWLRTGVQSLAKQLQDPTHLRQYPQEWDALTDLAYASYVLALHDTQTPKPLTAWLTREIKRLPPEALAYLTLSMQRQANQAATQAFASRLLTLANSSASLMNWDHLPALTRQFKADAKDDALYGGEYTFRFTGVETTALALRALATTNNDKTHSVVDWLLLQQGRDGWGTTKATAQVARALMDVEAAKRSTVSTADQSATVSLSQAGEALKLITWTAQTYFAQSDAVPVTNLTQPVDIVWQGSAPIRYTSVMNFFQPLMPGDALPAGSPSGLKLTRRYFRLKAQPIGTDGRMHLTSEPVDASNIRAGEIILMAVDIDAPTSLPYVLVEAPLASGVEVLEEDDSRDNNLEYAPPNPVEGDWGEAWWTHRDVLDDKIVFFSDQLKAGHSRFHALVRFEMPGKVYANPVRLEGMYSTRIRGYSALDQLVVSE